MNAVLQISKAVLPERTGKYLRRQHRTLVFNRAMRRYLANPVDSWQRQPALLSDLIYGWGNETYSAREEYLSACLRHAVTCHGPVLECGSGLTTLLVGALLQRCGGFLYSLEHEPAWSRVVRTSLDRYGVHRAEVIDAPLIRYGHFAWYSVPFESLPAKLALVICDGPPANTYGGRYGLAPLMRKRLADGTVILLDDAARYHEQAILRRWSIELGRRFEMHGQERPYARLAI